MNHFGTPGTELENKNQEEQSYITVIRIERLKFALDKYNYRIFSEDEYDETDEKIIELKESIAEVGLINPITVVKSTEERNTYEIVAGHRRFIACKLLNFTKIPCIVVQQDDAIHYVIGLVENLQRNNMKPLEEAIGIQKYAEQFNITSKAELSRKIGKSFEFVRSRLIMLELPEEYQLAINNKDIALTKADYIVRHIINDDLRNDLFDFLIKKKLNSFETDRLIEMTENYEKTFKMTEGLSDEQLKEYTNAANQLTKLNGFSLTNMMRVHDVQFVEGYLRLNPRTFPERGKYSDTTQTINKLIEENVYYSDFKTEEGIARKEDRNKKANTYYKEQVRQGYYEKILDLSSSELKSHFFNMVDILDIIWRHDSKRGLRYSQIRQFYPDVTKNMTRGVFKKIINFCIARELIKLKRVTGKNSQIRESVRKRNPDNPDMFIVTSSDYAQLYILTDKGRDLIQKVRDILNIIL